MIKILIVDDEEIERKAMRKILMRGVKGAEVVGEAANGRKAIELAYELEPDIIMMDIKMPGVDGVEAVKTIRKNKPDTKFVMVTAFDTFEYAREVMKEGVREYLLKPGKKSDIVKTVHRVIQEVRTEQAEREKLDRTRSFAESEWIASLLLGHIHETEMNEWNSFLDLNIRAAYAVVFRIDVLGGTEHFKWLKEKLETRSRCVVGPLSGQQITVLVSIDKNRESNEITVQSEAVQLVKEVIGEFEQHFSGIAIKAGIGTPVVSTEHFTDSYEEALVALNQANGQVKYLYFHPGLGGKDHDSSFYKIEKVLLDALKEGDREKILQGLESYLQYLTDSANGEVNKVQQRLQELWAVISRMTEEMGITFRMPYSQQPSGTLNQIRESARIQLLHVADRMESWHKNETGGLLFQAKEYMKDGFDKPLTLEDVAAKINISSFYFSKLFKESEGITFVEYLTNLRLLEAKKLLRTSEMSQKEICYQIGYRDPNYFSRVFKKFTGISPSEYRTKHRS